MYRTNTCGELTIKDKGKEVTLSGWVNSRRDHGGVIFIDLRDRYGITQIKCDPKISKDAWAEANKVRDEFVVKITGKVAPRPKDMVNPKLGTGEIEVEVRAVEVLNKSKTPPFEISADKDVNEEVRLKYRYLDLRRVKMKKYLGFRYRMIKFIRDYLDKEGFWEIETPILTKSTPEGARDYLVPSRQNQGKFYALPQSPQQYKQMLMAGGIDKYFQIAKCFRDEDQRGDRQPEFTQLDLEMSFVEREDILDLTERLFTGMVEKLLPEKKIKFKPWPRIPYEEAMLKYGIDKPDLRFGLEIEDISELARECDFKVFSQTVKGGGVVRALRAKGGASLSRSELDKLEDLVKEHGGKGLAYITLGKEIKSPLIKFLGEEMTKKIIKEAGAKEGDIIFFGAGEKLAVCESMAYLRLELGKKMNLIKGDELAFAFIIDFPLFEEGKLEDGHYAPSHHMFTMPKKEDWPLLDKDPSQVKSYQYDMVLNGTEAAGGSIRIHRPDIQEKIFKLIGFKKERIKFFHHMLEAFGYGTPPHGGIAPGLDRLAAIFMGEESIREVIAFPKNQRAEDLMIGAPSEVDEEQLKELGISVNKGE